MWGLADIPAVHAAGQEERFQGLQVRLCPATPVRGVAFPCAHATLYFRALLLEAPGSGRQLMLRVVRVTQHIMQCG